MATLRLPTTRAELHPAGGDLARLRASIDAARGVVRSSQRHLRTAGQFLADLEDRLDAYEASLAQPTGGTANGNHHEDRAGG